MIIGTDYYAWNPCDFKYRKPGTFEYYGNVIGNTSLEDLIKVVSDTSDGAKNSILEVSNTHLEYIRGSSSKYTSLWENISTVTEALIGESIDDIRAYIDEQQQNQNGSDNDG